MPGVTTKTRRSRARVPASANRAISSGPAARKSMSEDALPFPMTTTTTTTTKTTTTILRAMAYPSRSKGSRDVPNPQSSDGEDDDAADKVRATQAVEKEVSQHKENMASDHGIIKEVYCRNIMCHSKLRIKLFPLVEFILSHNGSGKSEIGSALAMCLGSKTIATNHGANLESLIKKDKESATLAVKITNRGDRAYKTHVYGSSITIKRTFTRSGTNSVKIKSSEGTIISTEKADLDDVLDFFAFQLDNLISVLTHDKIEQSLASSTRLLRSSKAGSVPYQIMKEDGKDPVSDNVPSEEVLGHSDASLTSKTAAESPKNEKHAKMLTSGLGSIDHKGSVEEEIICVK